MSFEKIDSSLNGGQDARYVISILLLIGGVLTLFLATGTGALVGGSTMVVVAVLSYARLLRKTPQLHYFRYFWLDKDGVHHIEGSRPNSRTAHFAWSEIQSAEASNDEFKGVVLTLKRRAMQGVQVFLTTDNAKEAAAAIRRAIDSA